MKKAIYYSWLLLLLMFIDLQAQEDGHSRIKNYLIKVDIGNSYPSNTLIGYINNQKIILTKEGNFFIKKKVKCSKDEIIQINIADYPCFESIKLKNTQSDDDEILFVFEIKTNYDFYVNINNHVSNLSAIITNISSGNKHDISGLKNISGKNDIIISGLINNLQYVDKYNINANIDKVRNNLDQKNGAYINEIIKQSNPKIIGIFLKNNYIERYNLLDLRYIPKKSECSD